MAAIPNIIKIGSTTEPDFTFDNDAIDLDSIDIEENVDLIESELAIDVFNVVVKYVQGNGADLRAVPYGTPVFHYVNGSLVRKYYIKKIDRVGRTKFKISTFSAIGILSRQYHKGGVYTGITFADLIDDLIDDAVPYSCDLDVGATKIFGWLPYATKRENLHQIMFAENISIVKDANCDIRFTFLRLPQTPAEIPQNRIFIGGAIEYPAVASLVQLTEHSYQPVDLLERVTLIDNSDKTPANNKLFVFDTAPIIVSSLIASSGLTVVEAGVNYAIVTGQGTLTGIPYYDKTSIVQKSYNSGGEAYSVSVERGTLVTGVNSENVIDRLLSFYTSNEKVTADVKVLNEKCGEVYSFTDMYGDTIIAYLAKMTSKISSLIRSACKFITGYQPETFGNNYTHWAAVEHNGWIEIPEGTTIARFVIIGGGDGASSGLRGVDDFSDLYAGSKGGEPGTAGKGGKIREIVLHNPTAGTYNCTIGNGGKGGNECESPSIRNNGEVGEASTVTTPGGTVYSSEDSGFYRSTNGIKNLFTDTVYAKSGKPGIKGGDGGRGSVSGLGEDGQDVEYLGKVYKGGKGGAGTKYDFKHIDQSLSNGGAGGSGAQAYADGLDGGQAESDGVDFTTTGYKAWELTKQTRGKPPLLTRPSKWKQEYQPGDGGDAGQGGAGRGGFGGTNSIYMNYTEAGSGLRILIEGYIEQAEREEYGFDPTVYHSSNGSAGKRGAPGIVICYADQPLESYSPVYETPVLLCDGYDSDVPFVFPDGSQTNVDVFHFSWDDVGATTYLFQYRVSRTGGYIWGGQDPETLDITTDEWTEEEVIVNGQTGEASCVYYGKGTLLEARVMAIGDSVAADSEFSNTLTEYILPATNYAAPDLKAAPNYKNGVLNVGLFADAAERTYNLGSIRWQTIFRRKGQEEYEFLAHKYLPDYDLNVEKEIQYGYKSAYLNGQSIVSPFSEQATVTLPQDEEYETKLLPPVPIAAYYHEVNGIGQNDNVRLRVGYNDDRANRLEIWGYKIDESFVLVQRVDLSAYQAQGTTTYTSYACDFIPSRLYPGRILKYKIRHTDNGNTFDSSEFAEEEFEITVPQNKLPDVDITGKTLDGNQLTLTWTAAEGATSYRVGRWSSSQGAYILVTTVSTTTATVTVTSDDVWNNNHAWFVQAVANGYRDSQSIWVYVPVSGDEPNEQVLFDSSTNLLGTFLYGSGPTVVTVANNTLTVQGHQAGAHYPAYSANKIDLTNATQLKFTGTFEKLGYNLEFGFCDTRPEARAGDYKTGDQIIVVYGVLNSNQSFNDSLVLDVTNYTGEHYFYFNTYGDDGSSSNVVNRLALTKISLAQA